MWVMTTLLHASYCHCMVYGERNLLQSVAIRRTTSALHSGSDCLHVSYICCSAFMFTICSTAWAAWAYSHCTSDMERSGQGHKNSVGLTL